MKKILFILLILVACKKEKQLEIVDFCKDIPQPTIQGRVIYKNVTWFENDVVVAVKYNILTSDSTSTYLEYSRQDCGEWTIKTTQIKF